MSRTADTISASPTRVHFPSEYVRSIEPGRRPGEDHRLEREESRREETGYGRAALRPSLRPDGSSRRSHPKRRRLASRRRKPTVRDRRRRRWSRRIPGGRPEACSSARPSCSSRTAPRRVAAKSRAMVVAWADGRRERESEKDRHRHSLESRRMVTGPSFTRWTAMWAWNFPVSVLAPSDRVFVTNVR